MPQSLARILVHVVFSTKHRQPLIKPEVEDELFKYICGILREHESPALAINGTEDHVHILISLSRKVALSDLLEEVKRVRQNGLKPKGRNIKTFIGKTVSVPSQLGSRAWQR